VTCEQLTLQPKQVAQKTHGLSTVVTKNTPLNFNDCVTVRETVGALIKQQYITMVNSMAMNTKGGWPHRTNYFSHPTKKVKEEGCGGI
jgi:hypothetical protein